MLRAAAAAAYLLAQAIPHPAIGIISAIAAYLLRLIAVGGIVTYLVSTTTPIEFAAALRAARISRAITVFGAVMFRFLRASVADARAMRDAMRLRGIGCTSVMLRHPIPGIEHFTVPLIASSLRVSETFRPLHYCVDRAPRQSCGDLCAAHVSPGRAEPIFVAAAPLDSEGRACRRSLSLR
jgi:energy-coupling factor transporter transmembrane protein EcfT